MTDVFRHRPEYGGWRFSTVTYTVTYAQGRQVLYEIAVEDCHTCAEVLDWIIQVAQKPWADDRVLAGLVRIFDAVLNPQATMCGGGRDQQYGPALHAAQQKADTAAQRSVQR